MKRNNGVVGHVGLVVFGLLSCALVAGCSGAEPPKPAAISPADKAALDKAKEAAAELGAAVRARLMETMGQGGFQQGVTVCSAEAQGIAAEVQKETGVRVGRSSTRLRNPENAPPLWVADWLTTQGERKAEGVSGVSHIVDTAEGPMARFIKPIAVEGVCLGCHGDPQSIAADAKMILAEKYPDDQATGYSLGDLRGALWAEVAVTE